MILSKIIRYLLKLYLAIITAPVHVGFVNGCLRIRDVYHRPKDIFSREFARPGPYDGTEHRDHEREDDQNR